MLLNPGDYSLLVGSVVLLIILGLGFWLGPNRLSHTSLAPVVSGQELKGNPKLPVERGFIHFMVSSNAASLSHQEILRLAERFGVSEGAIMNINDARNRGEIELASNLLIRIPLRPR